ncbi:MAG: 1-deoxy-D-xylulose-5-phosphate reductoisomerase [Bacteroidia bacterium]|nr:1-deoxy-D-xylulose-5-phosphate reductoisomerase [Bacteroidia bacterium]
MQRRVAILGSTGSIGKQALEVISMHSQSFIAEVLTAQSNAETLINQALTFNPNVVVIGDANKYETVKQALAHTDVKVYAGADAIAQVVTMDTIDIVLTALVGYAGLLPTIAAIKAGKPIALANKETLVVAGEIITQLAAQHKVVLLPVDSEHSAIFQCLQGEWDNAIEKIYLTASGGPFRGKDLKYLVSVTKAQALKHPNWSMGAKITIDSASMMNKGLEMIEAKWLFNLSETQIDVVVHPQSIIHSMVQFEDGSIKAQMGLPDMRLPIQYALTYPLRPQAAYPRFDFKLYPTLTFENVDKTVFKNLQLAIDAMAMGGIMPCALNAANEIAVQAFLNDEIGFVQMSEVIAACLDATTNETQPALETLMHTDAQTRIKASKICKSLGH